MTITINGSGTIAGITAGGLPDAVIQTADIVDLAVTPAKMSQKLTSGTAVASTSGTSIDFTSIPSWVKRITVIFNNVSTNGTSQAQVQIGSGSATTTGYDSRVFSWTGGSQGATATTGFLIEAGAAGQSAAVRIGLLTICLLSGNTWVAGGTVSSITTNGESNVIQGNVTLAGTLDRLRITTVNGTDTFDAGSINIMYEG